MILEDTNLELGHCEIPVLVSPDGQNRYQPVVITSYDEEGLLIRAFFSITPGQNISIGMSPSNNGAHFHAIEILLKAQIIWCLQKNQDTCEFFLWGAKYMDALV